MSNEDRTIWVAQNGEIYNFSELRRALEKEGHQFKTKCDTEVLAHIYEEHGIDFPRYLNGMFAAAVWDDTDQVGVLARDRVGKKPLYYTYRDGSLYFASEIKGLLEIPGFRRRVNLEALHHFLSYKHVPCPLSIFEGIQQIPPGHTLVFRPGSNPRLVRYWKVDFSQVLRGKDADEEAIAQELLCRLRDGVKKRLMSDVPIGFFLSGGVDSGLCTALAAELSPTPIKTFTLVYAEESSTGAKDLDRQCAKRISEIYDTEHHEERVDFAGFPDQLPAIIKHFDEPFAGVVSSYFLSRLISKHVKVTLSGDAADELFGSYLSHRLAFAVSHYLQLKQSGHSKAGEFSLFEGKPHFLSRLAEKDDWKWRYKLLVFTDEEKQRLYARYISGCMSQFDTLDHLRGYFRHVTAQDPLNRILEAEFVSFFPDQVLTYVDRLSMAHSLEVRTAYLDVDFVNYVASIPGHLKIKNGETKYILKKAALKYLPEDVVFRKKEGFLMPITQWILQDLEDYVRDTLTPARLKGHGLFDVKYVEQLVLDLYSKQSDYMDVNKVYALLVFQEWYDLYMH
jgi:asparagine synthase (glutamine-hydrolysing)